MPGVPEGVHLMASTSASDLARVYQGNRSAVARRLRALADQIEERPIRTSLNDLLPDHMDDAQRVIHYVTGVLPNLRLDSLIRAAVAADAAVRKEHQDEASGG